MFKVGDLVIGNSKNDYGVTCKGTICLVLDVSESSNTMLVHLITDNINKYVKNEKNLDLNPKNYENCNNTFWVECRMFDLFPSVSSDNILTGLFFRKDVKKLTTLKKEYVSDPSEYIYIGEI